MRNRLTRPVFGITSKLTSAFGLFSLFILSSFLGLVITVGREQTLAIAFAALESSANEKEMAFEDWKASHVTEITTLADLPRVRESAAVLVTAESGSSEARQARVTLIAELQPWARDNESFFALLVIESEQGQVIAATDPSEEGKFQEDRLFFIEGKSAPYMQSPYYSITLQAPAMTAAAPIRDNDGRLLAVLAGRMDMAELSNLLIRNTSQYATRDVFFVNPARLFVTQPRFVPDPAVLLRSINTVAVNNCLTTGSGQTTALDYRGVPVVATYHWLPEDQLCLIVKMDETEALKPINDFVLTIVALGFTVLALALALAVWLARQITRPVLALQHGAAHFGQGNLNVRLPETSHDELGQLAHEFNQMATVLSEKEVALRQYTSDLERTVSERTVDLRRSNAELEQFAYVASHDLQEPLRMISSYTQLLAKRYQGRLDTDADEFIAYAVDGATRMQTLINDLLTYSRVGTRTKPFVPTHLAEVLALALTNLRVLLHEQAAVVTNDDLPIVVGDESQLVQLFQNLIGNAVKFRGAAPPHVHVSVREAGPDWVFSVRDNGIGFDPQFAERIFVIFQRLHTKTEYAGTGIGLALCKKIVERHGGRIWAESQPGAGATFYFALPKGPT